MTYIPEMLTLASRHFTILAFVGIIYEVWRILTIITYVWRGQYALMLHMKLVTPAMTLRKSGCASKYRFWIGRADRRYSQKRVRKVKIRVKKGEKVGNAYYCTHPFPTFPYHLHAQLNVVVCVSVHYELQRQGAGSRKGIPRWSWIWEESHKRQ
jgi:hypothetical protein